MSVLIEKLSAEIPNWKNVISSIEREDSNGSRSLRDGEREVFLELKEFWKYNDFNPNRAKDLINELKKHEPYHAPKWDELGEFRRICVQYYTKDNDAYEAFQRNLGGKVSGEQPNYRKDSKNEIQLPSQINVLSLVYLTHLLLERHENCDYTFLQRSGYDNKFLKHEEWWKKNTEGVYTSICKEHYQSDCTFMHRSWFNGMSGMMLLKSIIQPPHHLILLVHDNSDGRKYRIINPYDNSNLNFNFFDGNSKLPVYSFGDDDFADNIFHNNFFQIHEKIKKILLHTINLINN